MRIIFLQIGDPLFSSSESKICTGIFFNELFLVFEDFYLKGSEVLENHLLLGGEIPLYTGGTWTGECLSVGLLVKLDYQLKHLSGIPEREDRQVKVRGTA